MNGSYLKVFVDWKERYQKLSDAEFGRLMRAAIAYKATGEQVTLPGREEIFIDGIKLDIDRDNEKQKFTSDNRSEAGKRGAEARWGNMGNGKNGKNGNCHLPYGKNGYEEDKDEDEEDDKDNEEEERTPKPPKKYNTKFDEFWAAYPKKMSKGDAEIAWEGAKPSSELLTKILSAIERAKTCDGWIKEGGKYIPYPGTWIRAKGWEDELQTNAQTIVNGHIDGTAHPNGGVWLNGKQAGGIDPWA